MNMQMSNLWGQGTTLLHIILLIVGALDGGVAEIHGSRHIWVTNPSDFAGQFRRRCSTHAIRVIVDILHADGDPA